LEGHFRADTVVVRRGLNKGKEKVQDVVQDVQQAPHYTTDNMFKSAVAQEVGNIPYNLPMVKRAFYHF